MTNEELITYREDLMTQLRQTAEILTIMVLNAPMKPSRAIRAQAENLEKIEYQLKMLVVKKS